jgi:hypothetical protein
VALRFSVCEADYPIAVKIGDKNISLGSAEIRVTTEDGTVLAAPNLILR